MDQMTSLRNMFLQRAGFALSVQLLLVCKVIRWSENREGIEQLGSENRVI